MVLNANFLPCYNGYIIKKNRDCVEVMGEHAHTQVKMCGHTPFPPLFFCQHKMPPLILSKWGKKFLVIFFSHNQQCGTPCQGLS